MIYWWPRYAEKKTQWYVCTWYPTQLSMCFYLSVVYLVYHWGFVQVFHEEVFAPWATFIMQLEGWKFFLRVLSFVRSLSLGSELYFIGMMLSNFFTKISESMFSLLLHYRWYDLPFIVLTCVTHHSFLLSHYLHLIFHHFFLTIYPIFVPFQHLCTFPIRHLSSWSLMAWSLLSLSHFTIDIPMDSS